MFFFPKTYATRVSLSEGENFSTNMLVSHDERAKHMTQIAGSTTQLDAVLKKEQLRDVETKRFALSHELDERRQATETSVEVVVQLVGDCGDHLRHRPRLAVERPPVLFFPDDP
jgi:hypothetical protein